MAGTGFCSASSGSQMRAARWQPSLRVIQVFSISLMSRGSFVTVFIVIVDLFCHHLLAGGALARRRSLPAAVLSAHDAGRNARRIVGADLRSALNAGYEV